MQFCLRKLHSVSAILTIAILITACNKQQIERETTVQILTPKISPQIAAKQQNLEASADALPNALAKCGCIDQSVVLPDGTVIAPTSCKLDPDCGLGNIFNPPTYLHLKHKSTCYSVYGEYYVEAKTTAGPAEGSPGVPTENLSIAWRVNGAGRDKACGTGTFCAQSDTVYGYCVTSLCSKAQMIIRGQTVTVSLEDNCKV